MILALRPRGSSLEDLEEKIKEESTFLVNHMLQLQNKAFDPRNIIMCSVLNILFYIICNKRYEPDDPELISLIEVTNKRFEALMKFKYMDFVPFIKYIPNSSVETLKACNKWLVTLVKDFIDQHIRTFDSKRPRDMIDRILLAQEGDFEQRSLTKEEMIWTIQNTITAGFETTAVTMLWGLAFLASNQNEQRRVQTELDHVIQSANSTEYSSKDAQFHHASNLSWQDREKLPYLMATILEIQRLGNIIPFIFHRAKSDTSLQGKDDIIV